MRKLLISPPTIAVLKLHFSLHTSIFQCNGCSKPMGELLDSMFLHRGKVNCESCYAKAFDWLLRINRSHHFCYIYRTPHPPAPSTRPAPTMSMSQPDNFSCLVCVCFFVLVVEVVCKSNCEGSYLHGNKKRLRIKFNIQLHNKISLLQNNFFLLSTKNRAKKM